MPPIEQIRALFRYDPETGKLYWLPRTPDMFADGKHTRQHLCARWNTRYAGKEAFTARDNSGYPHGTIFDVKYRAHVVIWALVNGHWPSDEIDHIDHNRANGRIDNLRAATHAQNMKNHTRHRDNKSGFNGVSWDNRIKRWVAKIGANGRNLYLGCFTDIADAVSAREAANVKFNFHPNHGRVSV